MPAAQRRVGAWHARAMPPDVELEIDVPGAVLRAERWPAPAPTVVMLHSGVTDRRSWYAVADELGEAADMIVYDRRGFGASPPGELAFSHLADLVAVIDQLATGPVVLVGNSMGGALALDLALTEPQRVAGLLLLSPAVSGAPEPVEMDAATLVLAERIDRAWNDGDKTELVRLESWMWLDGPTGAEGRVTGPARRLAEEMNRQLLSYDVDEGAGGSDVDAWSRIEEIDVPAIVACGELDAPFIVDRSRQLAERLPRGRFVPLPDVAHLPGLEQPTRVAELVAELIRQ
jgi:pimeloyl-ACP methyl ester carboxylesterase